ncbi:MAG: aminoglycoside phosphotransferase family protein [Verrucomicrobiaceae bacterium]|jgi:aminoglycoside phosphotransferase (APT) family kinase protein|nr:aminoglycoside phosphotransferase family protein [Verrucomicrobiaceae bacterium]
MTSADLLPHLEAAGLTVGAARMTPLTGGVSSDISLVESSSGTLVVKAALEKLRVKDDWFADVSRNRVEQDFFDFAAPIIPAHVPRILGRGEGWFAMEYLGEMPNWKTKLLSGDADESTAKLAGDVLGRLHAASWLDDTARTRFNTLPNFHALRIEPYLLKTAERVPEAAPILLAEAARLAGTQLALVHGDYSPKNLLVGPQRLIVLDAECAWFGDPAFDTAFMLTHLHLKALLHRDAIHLVSGFWSAYSTACGHDLEERTVQLLLCLVLARVHGKSPVEYLSDAQRGGITRFVLAHLSQPPSLETLTAAFDQNLISP